MCNVILIQGVSVIDFCVTTEASNRLVRQIIPILARRAMSNQGPLTYGELALIIDHGTTRLGYQLGCIIDVIEALRNATGQRVPHLTGLCKNAYTGLPGGSFDRIWPGYAYLSDNEKANAVAQVNQEAYDYQDWPKALTYLGL